MQLDEFDIKMLKENVDESLLNELNLDNLVKILKYLEKNGVYYAKDLLINSFDLFLLDYDNYVDKFEKLKLTLGENFVEKLGDDFSYIDLMYQ